MAQKRVAGGIIMLLLTVVVPPTLFAVRGSEAVDEMTKSLDEASAEIDKSLGTSATPASAPSQLEASEERARREYIRLVDLYDFQAKYYESVLEGRVPGVDFKLRNHGNRTLKTVEVTVYFRDRNGNVISEENYFPVNTSSWMEPSKPLKPNYIWQMERGRFYSAKEVPDEWQEGNALARVTDLEFED